MSPPSSLIAAMSARVYALKSESITFILSLLWAHPLGTKGAEGEYCLIKVNHSSI